MPHPPNTSTYNVFVPLVPHPLHTSTYNVFVALVPHPPHALTYNVFVALGPHPPHALTYNVFVALELLAGLDEAGEQWFEDLSDDDGIDSAASTDGFAEVIRVSARLPAVRLLVS